MNISKYLQSGSHSIDVIIAVYEITMQRKTPECSEVVVSYKEIATWITKNCNGNISTIAYRERKTELLEMDLIAKIRRKRGSGDDIKLTDKGLKIAEITKKFLDKATQINNEKH
jgi:hypothetical protein